MNNDVAIFLDLDNVVIGAAEANLTFDVNLVLSYIRESTKGRLVLHKAYGDWRQGEGMTKELAAAGFELQSIVRLSNSSKNLADMQMVVDAMETLVDGHNFTTYVLITGDRDFMPLVQSLRKRGKQVIGVGVKHVSSNSLVNLCDHYVYYEDLAKEAYQLQDKELEDLIQRALDQLLQEKDQVPASLLKQRIQTLSKGVFTRSRYAKKGFLKLLAQYPGLVHLEQEGTTLYASRPQSRSVLAKTEASEPDGPLPETHVEQLLRRALTELLKEETRVRASLLKQWLQELSNGAFNESQQGDRSFRKFLERYPHLIEVQQESTTLYVSRPPEKPEPGRSKPHSGGRRLSEAEMENLLHHALQQSLADQTRARASLLKQRLQELSAGAFDEAQQGYDSFRHFLEQYPHLLALHQKGTTLFISHPEEDVAPTELHLRYRSGLKKRGLRIVPATVRLTILKDLTRLLQHEEMEWSALVETLARYYQSNDHQPVSKSMIHDVLAVARRAGVVQVQNGSRLATSPVQLEIRGDKLFQDAVMRCDAAYLDELQTLPVVFDLEEAALALYESTGHARYLKVIMNRSGENGQGRT